MKILYIECNMGAAGDMLLAALLELLPDPDGFLAGLNALGIPGVRVTKGPAVKCGITGTHVSVRVGGVEEEICDIEPGHDHGHGEYHEHEHGHAHHEHGHAHHEHHHTGMAEIEDLLAALPISEKVRSDALLVYRLIAEAEAAAHGRPMETVHFHEVGMMDAVTDIVGVCLALESLAPSRIIVSPIHVGSGQVHCAHGILPVPAPATAFILRGLPSYGGALRGELCTPTGAALLRHFADEFGAQPAMVTEKIGYGMGKKDFPGAANCLRAFLGESARQEADIMELAVNLDDMTGEELGFALETLLEGGALDAFLVPIQMKKSRPGHMLVCLCRPDEEEKMRRLLLRHTTTLGVRSRSWHRHTLERSIQTVETELGTFRVKTAAGYGIEKSKAEYEDLARLARENSLSLAELRSKLGL